MRWLKLLVIDTAVVLWIAVGIVGSALAEEKTKMLPETGVAFTMKGEKGKWVQNGGPFLIECGKALATGTITSANLGTYQRALVECKTSLGAANSCTGTGEPAGVILSEGAFHFWLAKETLGGVLKLIGVLAALPIEIHFTCILAGVAELVLVKGCLAALTEPLNTLASKIFDRATQHGGVQLILKVLSTETSESLCELLSSVNGGPFKTSGLEDLQENEQFKSGGSSVTVLLMNPEAVN